MKITLGDGSTRNASDAIVSAFSAVSKGEATPHQQKLFLAHVLYDICEILDVPSAKAAERATGFADGARWAGITIGKLCGGVVPTIKRVGDTSDGQSDT